MKTTGILATLVAVLCWQKPQSSVPRMGQVLERQTAATGVQCSQCKGTGWNPRTKFRCVPCGGDGTVGN